jgi:hypothetical protein
MRQLILFCFFVTGSIVSFSQSVYRVKADSVAITNDSLRAELILENGTKNINGFLYNKGNGRTEFRKPMVKLNDSTYLFGEDTLKLNPGGSASYILNQYAQKQNAKAWIDSFRVRSIYIPDSVNKTISRYSESGISIVGAIKDSDTSTATFSKSASRWNTMNPPLIDLSTPYSRNSYDIWGSALLRATRQWHVDTSFHAWWGSPNNIPQTDPVASINQNIWLKAYTNPTTYNLHSDPWRGQTFRVITNFGKTGETAGSWKLQYAFEPLQNMLSYIDFNNGYGSSVNFDFDPSLYAARIQLNRADTFRSIRYYTITPAWVHGSRAPGTGARYQVGFQVPDMASWDIADKNYAFQSLGPSDSNYFAGPTRFPFLGNGTGDQYLGVDSKGVLKIVSGSGGGAGVPAGSNGELQYNYNGSFGATSGIIYNAEDSRLKIANTSANWSVFAQSTDIDAYGIAGFYGPLTTSVANGKALGVGVTGEDYARSFFYTDGSFGIGAGNTTRDIFLSRHAANTFKISSDRGTGAGKLIVTSLATGAIAPATNGTTKTVVADENGLLSFADAPLMTKAVSFQSPTSSENVSLWYTPVALTITQVGESIRGTSPSVTYNIRYAATRDAASPTAVFASDRAVTSASGTTVSTFANASIPAGSWIWITTSATSGTVNDFNATIIYKQ